MNEREQMMKASEHLRLRWVVVVLTCGGMFACARSEQQAPAKEAPSAAAVPAEEQRAAPAQAVSPEGNARDEWPQAGAAGPPPPAKPKAEQPSPAPLPLDKPKASDATEKKKDSAKAAPSRAAQKPGNGAAGAGVASEGEFDDEASPALAASQSWSQLNVAFGELESALALSVPDCGAAERFRQNVCTLAERICTLEQDLPSTTPHNCADGRKRCSDATSRYHGKCDH